MEPLEFTYTKQQFWIKRYIVVLGLILAIVYCAVVLLPIVPPLVVCKTLLKGSFCPDHETVMIIFGLFCIGGWLVLTMMLIKSFFALHEKTRLPITFSFSGQSVTVSYSRGKHQNFSLNNCLYTDHLFYAVKCGLFSGCWSKRIVLFFPSEKNKIIPLPLFGWKTPDHYIPLCVPVETAEKKASLLSMLQSARCRNISISWRTVLLSFFIPALFVWFHSLLAYVCFDFIGPGGSFYLCLFGAGSGILLAGLLLESTELTLDKDGVLFGSVCLFFLFFFLLLLWGHSLMPAGIMDHIGTEYVFILYCIETAVIWNVYLRIRKRKSLDISR